MTNVLAVAFEGHPIRVTNETPGRAAALDFLAAVGYAQPKKSWSDIQARYPDLAKGASAYSFGGRGRPTPVMGEQPLLKLLMVLEGPKAAAFREWASSILFRYLKGDRDLANEIHLRADLLEDGDEAPEDGAARIESHTPLPQVQPLEARLPLELAARLETAALSLFTERQWGEATELLQLALQYRALWRETRTPSLELVHAPDLVAEVEPPAEREEAPAGSSFPRPRGAATQRRASTAAQTPLELVELPPRTALIVGWEEISKGSALSVWEALGRYLTRPTRYPKFHRALRSLFGIKTPRDALRFGDELEEELQEKSGSIYQRLQLGRTRGKLPETTSPRFRIIYL